jgi:hypothetical protein
MAEMNPAMTACIEECLRCYRTCLSTAMGHCLKMGGEHVAKPHFTLMMACAEICRTAAHLMLIGSPHHRHLCAQCADVCSECAADCQRIGGMEDCVEACQVCARACQAMAF